MTILSWKLSIPTLNRFVIPTGESWAFDPPKEMKIADNLQLCPSHVTAAKVSATLPFVIPSELRISYTRHSSTATYAAFSKESRMILTENSKFDRKSGGSRRTCGAPFPP
jgi:hypothetical protein